MCNSMESAQAPSAQQVVKQFVRAYVKGRQVEIYNPNGKLNGCLISLDRKLTTLSVRQHGAKEGDQTRVRLEDVEEISLGAEAAEELGLPLDDARSCVLFQEGGQSVAICFRDVEERDTFGLCLSMFVDRRRNPAEETADDASASSGTENEDDSAPNVPHPTSAPHSTPSGGTSDEPPSAEEVVKKFVRKFVKGQEVAVLKADGQTSSCIGTLNRELTTFSIKRASSKDGKQRDIPLEQVEEILMGTDAEEDVELPVDDSCVTFLLQGGQGIVFCFEELEDRDTFALCFSMFVDGLRKKASRRSGGSK